MPSHLSAEPFRQRGGHCSGLRDTEDVREVLFPDGTRFIRGCLGEEPKWGKRRDPGDLGSNMGKQGKKKKKNKKGWLPVYRLLASMFFWLCTAPD